MSAKLPMFPTKKETCCLHTNLNEKHHSMGNMVCAREEGTPLVSQQGTDLLANLNFQQQLVRKSHM